MIALVAPFFNDSETRPIGSSPLGHMHPLCSTEQSVIWSSVAGTICATNDIGNDERGVLFSSIFNVDYWVEAFFPLAAFELLAFAMSWLLWWWWLVSCHFFFEKDDKSMEHCSSCRLQEEEVRAGG